ncbi:hypothetical protein SBOR_3145 [Sclerotinia borealis F-4128]|uniref:HMG box domain-containing protein n=1 Tax=Sclerotinia borealis (strain F-4128) TaxID=1432307 RepID=W9CKA8_SCLBF|nr:hypothetical protein SBOR_3145 [Sclerotinia borealis F-4128]
MLSNIGRAAIKRIGGSHLSTDRFLATIWQLQRVEHGESTLKAPSASFLARRFYATVVKVIQAKPTTAKKPATKTAPAKKPVAKKSAAAKPATKAAKKPVKKPVKKLVKKPVKKLFKKPVKKVKAKAKPKKKVAKKVILTDSQKLRNKLRILRVRALLSEGLALPKGKSENAFQVLFQEKAIGTGDVTRTAKEVAAQYKSASPAELERLNRIANENKAANAIVYKNWVKSHTPDVIRLANIARRHIRKLIKKPATPRFIRDDRTVKGPSPAIATYVRDRYATGEYVGIKASESLKQIALEYKELSPEQRKPYTDGAAADSARYMQEYKTVYKRDSAVARKAQAAQTSSSA